LTTGAELRAIKPTAAESALSQRQNGLRIEIVRDDDRRQEDAVVEKRRGRNIAAAGGDQLQKHNRRLAAAIGQARDGMTGKALLEVLTRGLAVTIVGEHRPQSLMRLGVIRVGP